MNTGRKYEDGVSLKRQDIASLEISIALGPRSLFGGRFDESTKALRGVLAKEWN